MLLNNNSSVHGIFRYSDDIRFEANDFVVEGNCIYICTASDSVIGELPSKHPEHYTAYPGDKITTAEEYYNYINFRDTENIEDKYVSAHALCDILENMYFGFGDNGLVVDHVIYNPAEGIDYSIKGVRQSLDRTTSNILDTILQTEDLNNGLIKISRNIAEVSDILQENYNSETFESDVVILRQYTYSDTSNEKLFRIQELIDPEKNKMYFRFSKGDLIDDSVHFDSASSWKNLYSDNEEIINKLNTINDYYVTKTEEVRDLYNRLQGKYCYRNVKITNPSSSISLRPGETKDIKSVESFRTGSCFLDVIIKSPISGGSNIFKNYSITIDAKDIVDAFNSTEQYKLNSIDDITLTGNFQGSGNAESLNLSVSPGSCLIKDIYYRDYTLGHIHQWVLDHQVPSNPSCLDTITMYYVCASPNCDETREETVPASGHNMIPHPAEEPNCVDDGHITYYECAVCGNLYYDEYGNSEITDPDSIIIPTTGEGHSITHYEAQPATCVETGHLEYWYCTRCHNYFTDAECTNIVSNPDHVIPPDVPLDLVDPMGGHSWEFVTQATCTHTGLRRCRLCNETEIIEMIPHRPGELVPASPANCGQDGNVAYYECDMCGRYFRDLACTDRILDKNIYASGTHDLDPSTEIILREADYTTMPNNNVSLNPNAQLGIKIQQCMVCHNWIESTIPYKLHHIYYYANEHYGGSDHVHVVDNPDWETYPDWNIPASYNGTYHLPRRKNGYIYRDDWTPEHQYIDSETVGGVNYDLRSDIPVIDQLMNHTIDTNLPYTHILADCTHYGRLVGTCSLCGQENATENVWNEPPTGHALLSGTQTDFIPNTCTESAIIIGTCNNCGSVDVEIIDNDHGPKGHSDSNSDDICDVCNKSLLPE